MARPIKKALAHGKDIKRPHMFRVLYTMGFLFSLAIALPLYVNSSFLAQYVDEKSIGLLYAAGSLITLLTLLIIPDLLKQFGNYRMTLGLVFAEIFIMIGLALSQSVIFIAPLFVIYSAIISVIFFNFDIFLENYSGETLTGKIRGTFLTILNVGVLISPFAVSIILTDSEYWKIYLLGTLFLGALMIFLVTHLRTFTDPNYEKISVIRSFRLMFSTQYFYRIFFANLVLRFFYSWMVIYTPIYLHDHIGFTWSEIGIILGIMLIPFVLFEIPAGRLADAKWGEKEMMSAGFIITGLTTMSLVFIAEPDFWLWAFVLFVTRIGASLIEITTESYFFKHVKADDASVISLFRNNRPIAYIIAPLAATVALLFVEFQYLFVLLGIIVLSGLFFSLTLRDTK